MSLHSQRQFDKTYTCHAQLTFSFPALKRVCLSSFWLIAYHACNCAACPYNFCTQCICVSHLTPRTSHLTPHTSPHCRATLCPLGACPLQTPLPTNHLTPPPPHPFLGQSPVPLSCHHRHQRRRRHCPYMWLAPVNTILCSGSG